MTKSELISAIGNRTLKKDADIKPVIDAAIDIITEQLAKGEDVAMVGFGSFTVKTRAAGTVRNPRTGESMDVPEKKVPSFKAGKALKDAVDKKAE